jgi:hypothetical protein
MVAPKKLIMDNNPQDVFQNREMTVPVIRGDSVGFVCDSNGHPNTVVHIGRVWLAPVFALNAEIVRNLTNHRRPSNYRA